jgi:hypothetical protein
MSGVDAGRIALAEASIEAALDPLAAQRAADDERDRKRADGERKAFLVGLMQNPIGRAWLKELLDEFHAFETRFASVNGYARDEMGTWVLAGEQRCGWKLWTMLDEADPISASRLRRGL